MTETNNKQVILEKVALVSSIAILGVAAVYWWGQIMNVVEMLSMAYG